MTLPSATEYRLIDAGEGQKLEQIGNYRVVRQATQAYWPATGASEQWQDADAVHHRSKSGGGHWQIRKTPPQTWPVTWGGYRFQIKLTDFGHIGLFPEQAENWNWIYRQCLAGKKNLLNLFGYTGGSTLAAAAAGAEVTHVDASKGVVAWARENATLNGLEDRPLRWIVEDVGLYIQREIRRGSRYQGVILDPPSFGRGPKGQVWKIEDHLIELLQMMGDLVQPLKLVNLSCHTPGYTGICLKNLLNQVFRIPLAEIECGEMTVPIHGSEMVLPAGSFARWAEE